MKSHLLVRVRLVCLLSEGVGVVMFPDMAALPVIAGLDHEGFPRGETDPAHHPPPPLTEEPLGALVVIVEEHGHPVMDKPSHQGNTITLAMVLSTILFISISIVKIPKGRLSGDSDLNLSKSMERWEQETDSDSTY